jgi:hypothetical protein
VPTFDVVLHLNSGMFRDGAHQLLESSPPVKDRIELGLGLWIGAIDNNLANALIRIYGLRVTASYA